VTVKKLAVDQGVAMRKILNTLHQDMNLFKKSARWVTELLIADINKKKVRTYKALAMLDNIVTMGKSAVSFHTQKIKQQSRQWLPKVQPGPIKG
jgi:hypothetical protein